VQGKGIDKGITPSQTVGPFFKYGLTPNGAYDWNDAFTGDLVTPDATGVLALVPADRRATLIAEREAGNGSAVYKLDLRLQGDVETVFFDV
jgi:protocatechuate 3,4-dioxygenase beta subunit